MQSQYVCPNRENNIIFGNFVAKIFAKHEIYLKMCKHKNSQWMPLFGLMTSLRIIRWFFGVVILDVEVTFQPSKRCWVISCSRNGWEMLGEVVFNPVSQLVKQYPWSHGGGAIITMVFLKNSLMDVWLFPYTYHLCYISGPSM